MNKLLVVVFVLIIVGAIVWFATTRKGGGEGEHLVVTGSAAFAPLMKEIAARYEARHPGLHVDVQGGGSARGLADVRGGLADIGMVSSRPGVGEDGLHWFAVARDGIGFIVHHDNPVRGLTKREIVAIYDGRASRWSAVGGTGGDVTAVSWEEGRGILNAFLAFTGLRHSQIKAGVIAGQDERVTTTVGDHPDAIGYLSLAAALRAAAGGAVRLVDIAGVRAITRNVGNGSYPAVMVHSLVTRAAPQGPAKGLIEFARSRQVVDLIKAQDLVPAGAP